MENKNLKLSPEEEFIMRHRGSVYGNHVKGSAELGKVWAAILSNYLDTEIEPIPPDIISLMMAAMKIMRMSQKSGRGHYDSALDARVYIAMAHQSYTTNRNNTP
jgi:hypothetical protein